MKQPALLQVYSYIFCTYMIMHWYFLPNWNKIINGDIFKGFNFIISSKGHRRNALFCFVTTFITNSSCNNLISHSNLFTCFYQRLCFRAVLSSQQTWEKGAEVSHIPLAPAHAHPPPQNINVGSLTAIHVPLWWGMLIPSSRWWGPLFFISTDTFVVPS